MVIVLPDALAALLSLQDYMFDKWDEAAWLKAEDEIFEKLEKIDSGILPRTPVQHLASVGILDYQHVYTSHHKLVHRRIGDKTYVSRTAAHRQGYPAILVRR